MGKSFYLDYPDIKKKKQHNPYKTKRSYPCDGNFWDLEQQEMYEKIYSTLKVFKHKYVNWSDISDLGNVVCTKYDKLGLKDLTSYNSDWDWDEDVIKQFYGTLFINSSCTNMEFMIGCKPCEATKKDLEKALGINSGDNNITALHSLVEWKEDSTDACSLYVGSTTNTKKVCYLKPEVDLIQKINRLTLLPREGTWGGCSDMLLKLTHAIYHEKHFDVAHFLLSEMRIAIETPDHALPYGHYIFRLLRRMKFVPEKIVGKKCSLLKYSPTAMEQPVTIDSIVDSILQLKEKYDEFCKSLEQRLDTLHDRLVKVERPHMEEVRRRMAWEKRF